MALLSALAIFKIQLLLNLIMTQFMSGRLSTDGFLSRGDKLILVCACKRLNDLEILPEIKLSR